MKGIWLFVVFVVVENRTCFSRGVCVCKWEFGIRVNFLEFVDVDFGAGILSVVLGW